MVYCGKPSKGCRYCRSRRIKCDQRPLGCSQCAKSCFECPGYRNELDLRFRDESDDVIRKAQKQFEKSAKYRASSPVKGRILSPENSILSARPKAKTAKTSKYEDEIVVSGTPAIRSEKHPVLNGLSQPLTDRATAFLLYSYIKGSHFDYLPELCEMHPKDMTLATSVQAVALASLAYEMSCPRALILAKIQYVSAIRETNAALESPTESVKDSTLVAVLLLSLFETIIHEKERTVASWTDHVNGAVALAVLRGPEQCATVIGRTIVKQIGSAVRVSAVQLGARVNPAYLALRDKAAPYFDPADPVIRLGTISNQFSDFRAWMAEGLLETEDVITIATDIDNQLTTLMTTMPDDWSYRTVFIEEDSKFVYGQYYHIYPNHQVANVWNMMHMTRVMIHEIIQNSVRIALSSNRFVPSEWVHLMSRSSKIAVATCIEICASVPQFTQCPRTPGLLPLTSMKAAAFGYYLIFPLDLVGECPSTPNDLRSYAVDRLRYIGKEMRIPSALNIAAEIERGKRLNENSADANTKDVATARAHIYHLF